MLTALITVIVVLLAIGVALAGASVRVLREYERGVIFRLGRVIDKKGPGLILLMPAIDRMVRVSLRTVTLNVPPQDVITRDNVPVRVDAVVYFRVVDANNSVLQVENYLKATSQIAQTTLRSVLGKADLDTLLTERETLNEDLQQIIDAQGEFQASAQLAEAAEVISRNPATIQLRYLQTLSEIGVNQNSTVVFPIPVDLIRPVLNAIQQKSEA